MLMLDHVILDPVIESPALAGAVKAFASLTREQKMALAQAVDGFFLCTACPSSSNKVRDVVSETGWKNRVTWSEAEWLGWETWAWYLHFSRTVSCP